MSSQSTTFTVRYWTLAYGFATSFILSMLLGGYVTLVATPYRPNTDLVYRFFAKFNPCIFFDHYPANLWGMLLIALFLYFELAMVAFIFLHRTSLVSGSSQPNRRPCSNVTYGCFMGPVAVTFCLFINIFTANLYSKDHEYGVFNATEYVSNSYPNVTNEKIIEIVGNLTRDERDGISKEIFDTVSIHTTWFIIYILGDIVFALLLWAYANQLVRNKSWTYKSSQTSICCHSKHNFLLWKWIRRLVFGIYVIGVPSFCLSLTIILFAYDGKNRMVADRMWKDGTPFVQSILVWFKEKANASIWFSLPMLFHHFFVLPSSFALKFKLSLLKERNNLQRINDNNENVNQNENEYGYENNDETDEESTVEVRDQRERGISVVVRPESIFSHIFQFFIVVIITTFAFHQKFTKSNVVPGLSEGFKAKPWAFIYVPLWLGMMLFVTLMTAMMQWR